MLLKDRKPITILVFISLLGTLFCSVSEGRVRNNSNKPSIITQAPPKEDLPYGIWQETSVSTEKALSIDIQPYISLSKKSQIEFEANSNVIPQNDYHLKNNTYLFSTGYGYSFGDVALQAAGGGFWGENNNQTRTRGLEGKITVDYFYIDPEMQDPETQTASSLSFLNHELTHQFLEEKERAKFWLKGSVQSNAFYQTKVTESGSGTAARLCGYYPISDSAFTLGLNLAVFNFSNETPDLFATYKVFQTRALDFKGQSIPFLIEFGGWFENSIQITNWDRFIGRMGILAPKQDKTLGLNLDLGWEHFWDKTTSLRPSYEISLVSGKTLSALKILWGIGF